MDGLADPRDRIDDLAGVRGREALAGIDDRVVCHHDAPRPFRLPQRGLERFGAAAVDDVHRLERDHADAVELVDRGLPRQLPVRDVLGHARALEHRALALAVVVVAEHREDRHRHPVLRVDAAVLAEAALAAVAQLEEDAVRDRHVDPQALLELPLLQALGVEVVAQEGECLDRLGLVPSRDRARDGALRRGQCPDVRDLPGVAEREERPVHALARRARIRPGDRVGAEPDREEGQQRCEEALLQQHRARNLGVPHEERLFPVGHRGPGAGGRRSGPGLQLDYAASSPGTRCSPTRRMLPQIASCGSAPNCIRHIRRSAPTSA